MDDNADEYGVHIYDFTVSHETTPVFDFHTFVSNLEKAGYKSPDYDLPARVKEKELILIPGELTIVGEAVEIGVQSLGEEWKNHIPKNILMNLSAYSINELSSVQDWILTMILHELPGAVFCGQGHRMKDTMVLGIASRVCSIAGSYCHNLYYDKLSWNSDEEYKYNPIDDLNLRNLVLSEHHVSFFVNRKSLQALLLTRLPGCSKVSMPFSFCNNGILYTDTQCSHITKEAVSDGNTKCGNLLVGTPPNVRDFLRKHNVVLDRLDSVYIFAAELYTLDPKREKSLLQVLDYLHKHKRRRFSTFLYYRRTVEISPTMQNLLPKQHTILTIPPKIFQNSPVVKVLLCNQENLKIPTCRKLSWLNSLIDKISSVQDQNSIGVERAKNLFRSRQTDFMVVDYCSLSLLEQGYTANIILFDLPTPEEFMKKMYVLSKLSSKITSQNQRQIYLLLDPEQDASLIVPVHKYLDHIGGKISETFEVIYQSLQETNTVVHINEAQ